MVFATQLIVAIIITQTLDKCRLSTCNRQNFMALCVSAVFLPIPYRSNPYTPSGNRIYLWSNNHSPPNSLVSWVWAKRHDYFTGTDWIAKIHLQIITFKEYTYRWRAKWNGQWNIDIGSFPYWHTINQMDTESDKKRCHKTHDAKSIWMAIITLWMKGWFSKVRARNFDTLTFPPLFVLSFKRDKTSLLQYNCGVLSE